MNKLILLFLLPVFLILGACHPKEKISVNHLQCEHVVNPIGLDVVHPRLSWQLTSSVNGEKQTAYQVIVATDPGKLSDRKADLWPIPL